MNKDPQNKYEKVDERFNEKFVEYAYSKYGNVLYNTFTEDVDDIKDFLHSALHDQEVETARRIMEKIEKLETSQWDSPDYDYVLLEPVKDIIKQFIN